MFRNHTAYPLFETKCPWDTAITAPQTFLFTLLRIQGRDHTNFSWMLGWNRMITTYTKTEPNGCQCTLHSEGKNKGILSHRQTKPMTVVPLKKKKRTAFCPSVVHPWTKKKKGQHSVPPLYTVHDTYLNFEFKLAPPPDPHGINGVWGHVSVSSTLPLLLSKSRGMGRQRRWRKYWLFSLAGTSKQTTFLLFLARRPTHLCDSTVAAPHFPFRPAFCGTAEGSGGVRTDLRHNDEKGMPRDTVPDSSS